MPRLTPVTGRIVIEEFRDENSRSFWDQVRQAEQRIEATLEEVGLRDGFRQILALSSAGNKRFQDEEPWKTVKDDPDTTAALLHPFDMADVPALDAKPQAADIGCAIGQRLGTLRQDGQGKMRIGAAWGIALRYLRCQFATAVEYRQFAVIEGAAVPGQGGRIRREGGPWREESQPEKGDHKQQKHQQESGKEFA